MNKIKNLFFVLVILFCSIRITSAQITFQKTYGGTSSDYAYSIQQTMDGGYIITGFTESFSALPDVYLIKTDVNGDTLWTKTLGLAGDDRGYSVRQTTDGGYIIVGNTVSFGTSNSNVYLIKTNAVGDTLWTKSFGGGGFDIGSSVEQVTDGGYIIVGNTNSFPGNNAVYLIRTDTSGNLLWTKTLGGINQDFGYSIREVAGGGYVIVGRTNSFGAGNYDVYLMKTDSIGNLLWSKTFGGSNDEWGISVQQTIDGGYVITGFTESFGAGSSDVYLIKTDANGDSLWTKTYGASTTEEGKYVQQTNDGGYIVVGYTTNFNNNIYLFKTDSIGNLIWSKTFGSGSDSRGYSIQQTTDGGYVITGNIDNIFGSSYNFFLIKTDSFGSTGCNQGNFVTIVNTPATQVTNPSTIVTSPASIVAMPGAIVGNGGTVTTLCTSVNIATSPSEKTEMRLNPNPSSGNFIITFPRFITKGKVEIYNSFGEKMFTENIFNTSQKEIHLKTPAGIYFLKVLDVEKQCIAKIIIEPY